MNSTNSKQPTLSENIIQDLVEKYETPFYAYDAKGIAGNAKKYFDAFSWHGTFKNYFAVKATPTPKILRLLQNLGMGMDCSSYAELMLMERMGIRGKEIFFSSNNTPYKDMKKALDLGAIINLDDISLLNFLVENFKDRLPDTLSFRFNPGPMKEGNSIIGKPEEAKYGLTKTQLFEAYMKGKNLGIKHFGLHTMVASNELNHDYFIETARILFTLAVELKQKLDITLEFINLGGGLGIPYKPEDLALDYALLSSGIQQEYEQILGTNGLGTVRLYTESGRAMTGPYGFLVSKVLHKKNIYKQYVGLDACMANLMRPGMYGAYHHLTVLGKEDAPRDTVYDVTGGLCENNDKFAINRALPDMKPGDVVLIHDTGAHGHAMGFNYNGKLRSAEILVHSDTSHELIRRAETINNYFDTMVF